MRIYFDMDNVLVNFSTVENEPRQLQRMYSQGFYVNLPQNEDVCNKFIDLYLDGYDVAVISGLIDSPYVAYEKKVWCQQNLGIPPELVFLGPREKMKSTYVQVNRDDILIDDYKPYIDDWNEHNGLGLLYSRKDYKAQNQLKDISDLDKYIFSWYKVGALEDF